MESFEPSFEIVEEVAVVDLPNPAFPAVPSAYYFYLSSAGTPTSYTGVGTQEEQVNSLKIWYAAKNPANLILTPYAKQACLDTDHLGLAPSITNRLRQVPSHDELLIMEPIGYMLSLSSINYDRYTDDIYLFPLHPDVNIITAADLALRRDIGGIIFYLNQLGIRIPGELEYYPMYYLFFLITRIASYPMTSGQIQLIQLRISSSPDRQELIDSIFELEITPELIQMVIDLPPLGQPGWTKFGPEYIRFLTPGTILDFEYLESSLENAVDSLTSWSDSQILDLCSREGIDPPSLTRFSSRAGWISQIVNMFRHRGQKSRGIL